MRVERGIYRRGEQFWIRYAVAGDERREPAGATLEEARVLLARRRVEVADGQAGTSDPRRVTLGEVMDDLLTHLATSGAEVSSRATYRSMVNVILADWGAETRALSVRPQTVAQYVERQLAAGAARSYVNRKVGTLRQALRIAALHEKLPRAPELAGVGGGTVRQGFVEPEQFQGILRGLLPDYADCAEFLYLTGRRYKDAITLTWNQVGQDEIIWGRLKNGDPLTLPLWRRFGEILARRRHVRTVHGRIVPLVFHARGRSLTHTLRTNFEAAANVAGLPGLTPHDLRRSAVRNLIRAGVSETVAMTITGHRSRDVFRRYDITSPDDKMQAFAKLERYLDERAARVLPLRRQEGGDHGA